MSFIIFKLGELGEESFGMLKLGELGEVRFRMYKLEDLEKYQRFFFLKIQRIIFFTLILNVPLKSRKISSRTQDQ